MAFDNNHPNRKDRRNPYYKSKRIDRSCRPGGDCPYCQGNRQHCTHKKELTTEEAIQEFNEELVCPECRKGTLKELSLYDDWDGTLSCDNCNYKMKL